MDQELMRLARVAPEMDPELTRLACVAPALDHGSLSQPS